MGRGLSGGGGHLSRGSTSLVGGGLLPGSRSRLARGRGVPPSPGAWRRHLRFLPWLLVPLAVLAIVLLANGPGAPSLRAPHAPRVHAPTIHFRGPQLEVHPPTPEVSSVHVPGLPRIHVQSPGFGSVSAGGESEGAPPIPAGPRTLHHLTLNHILHSHITWIWDYTFIILVALGFALAYFFIRSSPHRPWLAAVLPIALLASSCGAALAGFHQLPGPGIYRTHPRMVTGEDHDSAGDRIIEEEIRIDHYRPPLDADVALILASALLVQLALPSLRALVAVADRRRRHRSDSRRPRSPGRAS